MQTNMPGSTGTRTGTGGAATVVEAVRRWARERPEDRAFTFLRDRRVAGGPSSAGATRLTVAEVDARARALAARLAGLPRGARGAIVCPHGPDYVVAFLACLYAGVVAVPLAAPDLRGSRGWIGALLAAADPAVVLTTVRMRDAAEAVAREAGGPARQLLAVDDGTAPPVGDHGPDHEPGAGDLAYLQFTSGSTRQPMGVRITHANLMSGADQLRDHMPGATTVTSWAPLFHDMGLVFGVLHPLANRLHAVQMSPLAFIRDPRTWLEAVGEFGVEWATSTNFGLAHCMRTVAGPRREGLDLTSLRSLNISGEPVNPETVEAFAEAFGPCGLDPGAMAPSYGLAEATLVVTEPALGDGMRTRWIDRAALAEGRVESCPPGGERALRAVSAGAVKRGVSLRVVDPETLRPLGEERVGEVLVRGPNVADGYWQQPERSAEVFGARLASGSGEDGGDWLRTGDLGFLDGGHLYITGRRKDLIVVHGRNHYPDDIERTAQVALGEAQAAPTVVGVPGDYDERVVILVEHRSALAAEARDELATRLRKAVSRHHGLVVADVRFLKRGTLPRTTSGKIRRQACVERYVAGELAGDRPDAG